MSTQPDNFTSFEESYKNMYIYVVRSYIWKAVQRMAPQFGGRLLDVGCGQMPYRQYLLANGRVREYVGLDIETALVYDARVKPDLTWDGIHMPIQDEQFDTILLTEVLEHCPDPILTLREVLRVLKPGGKIFFTVPFVWNLHETPHDHYRYTPYALQRIFREAGVPDIEVYAHAGWNGSTAQLLGMWGAQAPMPLPKWARKLFNRFVIHPLVRLMLRWENQQPDVPIAEGMMINGLYGLAVKPR